MYLTTTQGENMVSAEKLNRMIEEVRGKLSSVDYDKLTELDSNMGIAFDEHFAYQNMQAEAHASGLLSPDAAQIVYSALGEVYNSSNGGWVTKDLATKVVVTQLMAEILERKIKTRTASPV